MNTVLLANAIALVGAALMAGIGFLKKRKQILGAQCVQFTIMGVSNLLLGGVTGFIANILSIIRNLLCFNRKMGWPMKLLFVAAQAVLSLVFNKAGLLGWLPFFAAASFTLFADTNKILLLKGTMIFGQTLWIIYDFNLRNYVTFTFDILTLVSTLWSVFSILRDRKKSTT